MPRKIHTNIATAARARKALKSGHYRVNVDDYKVATVSYRGTALIKLYPDGAVLVTDGGYPSLTTRTILNNVAADWGLPFRCFQQDHTLHATVNGVTSEWSGDWIVAASDRWDLAVKH